jgi:hypothetical protein
MKKEWKVIVNGEERRDFLEHIVTIKCCICSEILGELGTKKGDVFEYLSDKSKDINIYCVKHSET